MNYVTMFHIRSIERSAQHEALRTEQKAKGELERQKLQNERKWPVIHNTYLVYDSHCVIYQSLYYTLTENISIKEKGTRSSPFLYIICKQITESSTYTYIDGSINTLIWHNSVNIDSFTVTSVPVSIVLTNVYIECTL